MLEDPITDTSFGGEEHGVQHPSTSEQLGVGVGLEAVPAP